MAWQGIPCFDRYLFNVVFLKSLCGAVDSILLHLLAHVSVLDHGLSITHLCCGKSGGGKSKQQR